MDKRTRRMFADWSETDQFREAVTRAKGVVGDALSRFRKPCVAYSGGKDSLVMAHFVLQQAPATMVLHWDYGRSYLPQETFDEIVACAHRLGVKSDQLRIETSPEYERLGRRAVNVLGREYLEKLIPRLSAEGYDLSFVGLRKGESGNRKRRIRLEDFLTEIPESWPVADMTWLDIWAYIVENEIKYLSHYDTYGPVIGWDEARLCTFFDPEFAWANAFDGIAHWRFKHQG